MAAAVGVEEVEVLDEETEQGKVEENQNEVVVVNLEEDDEVLLIREEEDVDMEDMDEEEGESEVVGDDQEDGKQLVDVQLKDKVAEKAVEGQKDLDIFEKKEEDKVKEEGKDDEYVD